MVGQGQKELRSDNLMPVSFTKAVSRKGINGVIASTKSQNKPPC